MQSAYMDIETADVAELFDFDWIDKSKQIGRNALALFAEQQNRSLVKRVGLKRLTLRRLLRGYNREVLLAALVEICGQIGRFDLKIGGNMLFASASAV